MSCPIPLTIPVNPSERAEAAAYFAQLARDSRPEIAEPAGDNLCWRRIGHAGGLPCMQPAGHPGRCGA